MSGVWGRWRGVGQADSVRARLTACEKVRLLAAPPPRLRTLRCTG